MLAVAEDAMRAAGYREVQLWTPRERARAALLRGVGLAPRRPRQWHADLGLPIVAYLKAAVSELRVYLGAFGDPGHAFPMLALGEALVARGHVVALRPGAAGRSTPWRRGWRSPPRRSTRSSPRASGR